MKKVNVLEVKHTGGQISSSIDNNGREYAVNCLSTFKITLADNTGAAYAEAIVSKNIVTGKIMSTFIYNNTPGSRSRRGTAIERAAIERALENYIVVERLTSNVPGLKHTGSISEEQNAQEDLSEVKYSTEVFAANIAGRVASVYVDIFGDNDYMLQVIDDDTCDEIISMTVFESIGAIENVLQEYAKGEHIGEQED